ncbi:MAG: PSD1 and planctomycete cytochrome C domain-containing protein [Prosthecobacter sp.]
MRYRFFFYALLTAATPLLAEPPEKVRFNEHVRPILSTCFYCHGPDEEHRAAKLRLDVRDSAVKKGAIVPGKPDESELLARVLSQDPDDVMPPPKVKKPLLTADEVAILRRWIEQGAEYEGHWAFQPLRNDVPPTVKDTKWCATPVDNFIHARLEQEGVAASPEADRATLLRRVSLDLTGLLPTPEEVDAFLKDTSPKAYETVVNRLLASKHYGERWGRHWLDQARYADSNGYSIDSARLMWPYRDWVIAALNADMPFDRFTIEQLAGDLLPGATKAQKVATGFHRNTLINEEGGVDAEQMRIEAAMDRTATTGTVWLGLTVGCAQCHTHKFDPIPHREYYQLYSFFNSTTDVNTRGTTVKVAVGEMFGQKVESQAVAIDAERMKRQAVWEKAELARLSREAAPPPDTAAVKWTPAHYVEYDTASNASFRLLDDNSLLSDGRGSFNDTYRVSASTTLKQVAAVRLRTLTDDSLPNHGPGMARNGNFVLTDFELIADGQDVAFAQAYADHAQPEYPVSAAIDDDPKTGWAINTAKGARTRMNADHEAVFVLAKPVQARTLEVKLHHDLNQNYLIGRFALEFSESSPKVAQAPGNDLLAALRITPAKRSRGQKKIVETAFARVDSKRKKASGTDIDASTAEQMVMEELPQPRETFLLQRGDFLRPDKQLGALQPGVIAAVNAAFREPAESFTNRLDLARWLVSPENPLTPRVTVNRLWMHYFGRGLVETEDDFGTQGSMPTHPGLLDWLSREFIRSGWSMKVMHRLIVMSATYRQASLARQDLLERDPRNLLLARQERLRVEGEIIRDAALCASGLLNPTIGGPSVRPPQPDGVFVFTQTKKTWTPSTGANRFRRGMYTLFYRSAPYPLLTTFDAPNFQVSCTRRPRSDTPLQSLTLANDPAFLEIAQGFAARLLRELPQGTLDERLRRAFRLALGRDPASNELALLSGYTHAQSADFAQDPDAARAVAGPELAKSATPAEAAALVAAARVLFNTDNFITRE